MKALGSCGSVLTTLYVYNAACSRVASGACTVTVGDETESVELEVVVEAEDGSGLGLPVFAHPKAKPAIESATGLRKKADGDRFTRIVYDNKTLATRAS